MKTRYLAVSVLFLLSLGIPSPTHAQNAQVRDTENLEKARVLTVTNEHAQDVVGTSIHGRVQTLTIEVLDGPEKGASATFDNDFIQLKVGDVFYVRHTVGAMDGTDLWSVSDPYRIPVLVGLFAVFLVLLFLFGGIQGVRGLISLGGSLVLIFAVLLPGIYAGVSPILVCLGVASLIIVLGSYITHGFSKTTSAAVLGMIVTVLITGIGAYFAVHLSQLSGFTSENNVYLNFATNGKIDMLGLLFGGIMIGLLGVLYDIAIGQAVTVEELFRASSHYSRADVYRRALRVGREHIGALVNTLAIAYVGAALPLLLLFKQSDVSFEYVVNGEIFATEIVRILIGSIGLVLAVPVTTLIASYLLHHTKFSDAGEIVPSHSHR